MHLRMDKRIHCLVITAVFVSIPYWFVDADDSSKKKKPPQNLTVAQARSQAKTLHHVYVDTLDAIHRDYFREGGDRKIVPSRSLESVFRRQKHRTKVEARWLAVNADAMHVDHQAKSAFDKAAVRAISKGEQAYESVSDTMYRHAGAIPLFDSCLKCHLAIRSGKPRARYAALVISVPIGTQKKKQSKD